MCWEAADGKDFAQARQRAFQKIQRAAEGYDRIVVCRDAPPSFRKAIFAGYKADRADPGEAFREQLRAVLDDMREIGATVWASPVLAEHDGAKLYGEADDVIASFAAWYTDNAPAQDPPWHLRILSGDCDMWALVDDQMGIDVLTLEGKVITVDTVVERFEVVPALVSEIKALAGDKSDTYDGFKGIGVGVASKILKSPIERLETDRSAADAVIRAVLADADPGVKLAANVIASIKSGGLGLLDLGRKLTTLRWAMRTVDGEPAPLDFSKVLDEPRRIARPVAPTMTESIAALSKPATAQAAASTTALAVPAPAPLAQHEEEPFGRALKKTLVFANQLYESGLYRKVGNAAACVVLVEHARAFGVPAVIVAQHANNINGKLGFGAQLMLAVIRKHSSCRRFRLDLKRCNDQTATVLFWRLHPGDEDERGEYTFTIDDAHRAGWTRKDGPWKSRPKVMLCWAATRECARLVWPDVTLGIQGPDEIRDHGITDDSGEFPGEMVQEEDS